MKGQPIDQLVFDKIFPKPKINDPQNFQTFLQRKLVPEVRQETQMFYGHVDTQEAKYPGLDYAHATHRIRLSRFTWHRRLFRAFDSLGLTHGEIASLTKWEGTKWAKEKYEREQGIFIRDTAADGFPDWADTADDLPEIPFVRQRQPTRAVSAEAHSMPDADDDDDEDDENETAADSDGELESIGVVLNQRLRERAARRAAGDSSAVLDEEWEQWLKNAIETGHIAVVTEQMTEQMAHRNTNTGPAVIPAALIPPRMLSAARSGEWSDIPEILHPMLRRTLGSDDANQAGHSVVTLPGGTTFLRNLESLGSSDTLQRMAEFSSGTGDSWTRRAYSSLRLPVNNGESASNQRPAETSGA